MRTGVNLLFAGLVLAFEGRIDRSLLVARAFRARVSMNDPH